MIIKPKPSSKVLVNPGMGWTTFYSFNGDKINTDYPEASIAYFRFYWDDLEPNEGEYRWDIIDNLLKTGRSRGQKLAFRISAMDGMEIAAKWREKYFGDLGTKTNQFYRVPKWFYNLGRKGAICKDPWNPNAPEMWEPDYGDPVFLEKMGNLIAAFGQRYNGNPDIDHIDIGTMGRWGEWHVGAVPVPSLEARRRIVDMYVKAFAATPLLIPIADREALSYAVSQGAGWRADCLGDMRQDFFNEQVEPPRLWNHMEDLYTQQIIAADVYKAWKKAPIAFESGWEIKYWYEQGWSIDYIFAYALSMHVSIMNNKSLPIPEQWQPEINEFSKKMGYRFVLNQITFPDKVQRPDCFKVPMVWENKGVACCYGSYELALMLRENTTGKVNVMSFEGIDIGNWYPGRHSMDGEVLLGTDLEKGVYDVGIGIIDSKTKQSSVKIAIDIQDDNGWYMLGSTEII